MYVSPEDAFRILRTVSERAADLQAKADALMLTRDSLIRELDGQEGMNRTRMAETCGINRQRLWQIINPGYRGGDFDLSDEQVILPQDLYDELVAVGNEAEATVMRERPIVLDATPAP